MASEIRHIIFTDAELLRALSVFRLRTGKPIPKGTAKQFMIEERSHVRALLTVEQLKDGSDTTLMFEADEIGQALVMFCIHNKIPVPASGFTKEVGLTDGKVTLTVRSNLPTELTDHL